MPSEFRDPKNLADWIELDYFRRPQRLRRLWTPFVLVALLLSGGYVTYLFAAARRTAFQARPVSSAHAMFADNCSECHTQPFAPLARLWRGADHRSVPDEACLKCHRGDLHHATAVGERRCVSCHREHRGHAELTRVEDRHCTSCHADLQNFYQPRKPDDPPAPQCDPHVTAFLPGRHPDFRKRPDPGAIRFNHAVHLAEAGVLTVDVGQIEKQAEQAKKQGGRLYLDVGKGNKPAEKLGCHSCHQPDAAGEYMQPIRYEAHCKRCHPLTVQPIGAFDRRQEDLARDFAKPSLAHPAPHQSPDFVLAGVRDRLSRFIQAPNNKEAFLKGPPQPEPPRPIPGSARPAALARQEHEWVNHQQEEVTRLLFDGAGGCRYCHQETTDPRGRPGGVPAYAPSKILGRWQEHARFSHKSHRMIGCAECHPGAASSQATGDVLLPKMIRTCMECHSGTGGARSDCAACHLYHDPPARSRSRHLDGRPDRERRTLESITGRVAPKE